MSNSQKIALVVVISMIVLVLAFGTGWFAGTETPLFSPEPDDMYLTEGRWLTPDKREIDGKGITPKYVLIQTGE